MDAAALAVGILTATVVPTVGLVGVLVGSRMSARNDQTRWLRERRLMLATDALAAAAALNVALSVYVRLALESDERDGKVFARAQGLWDSWLTVYDQTRLVLPSDAQPLQRVHDALEQFMDLSEKSIKASSEPDDGDWDEAAMVVNAAISQFLNYARDLIHDA